MILTILVFLLILAILVFVHEFGHFIVARKTGMKVEEFGFGFPPRVAGVQKVDGKWRWVWGVGTNLSPNPSPEEGRGSSAAIPVPMAEPNADRALLSFSGEEREERLQSNTDSTIYSINAIP